MMRPILLEVINSERDKARALPPVWAAAESDLGRFSRDKSLYGYQRTAVDNALWALWLYFEKCKDYHPGESDMDKHVRNRDFAQTLAEWATRDGDYDLSPRKLVHGREEDGDVFATLSERIRGTGAEIPFEALCNRMSFWMATGSGKTLVMVKLIENLRRLMDAGEIPERRILILAPGALLLDQIHSAVSEYNRENRRPMDLVSLRGWNTLTGRGRDAVFYYDATNISDERKQVQVNWRDFDNNGEWYVLLDEAHRGKTGDSKRQAYYSLLARNGFLFNFSATFADAMDVCMTGARFNLGDFIQAGYGKHICLCGSDFREFAGRENSQELNAFKRGDYGDAAKRRVVLKSALALALVKGEIKRLRDAAKRAGIAEPYHNPLMVTMTNSVNTPQSDLAAYFKVLTGLAAPEGIDAAEFEAARREFTEDLHGGNFQFEGLGEKDLQELCKRAEKLSAADVCLAVFLTKSPGALEVIEGEKGKEIAIKLRTHSEPFGLIRIGETGKWLRHAAEAGIPVGKTVRAEAYFKELETSRITTLMGSRAFVESWDSVRPNVLNFVNIGMAKEAVKFIVQSIGRGVRIQPLSEKRRRAAVIQDDMTPRERPVFDDKAAIAAAETLFVFAAKRVAVRGALQALAGEASEDGWSRLDRIFKLNPRPRISGGEEMPLLVPKYANAKLPREQWRTFRVTEESERKILDFVKPMPECVFAVAHGIPEHEILDFRAMMSGKQFWNTTSQGKVFHSPESAIRGVFQYLRVRAKGKKAEGVRPLSGPDIVHFQRVEIQGSDRNKKILRDKISGDLNLTVRRAEADWKADKIDREELNRIQQKWMSDRGALFPELVVRDLAEHYYSPLVTTDNEEKAKYIRRIVKVKSEVQFLDKLAKVMKSAEGNWKAWMFSKLDENTDQVFIPYHQNGELHEFHPDFVFWMCRDDEYRIVFVDPKGRNFTNADHKLDGYARLFKDGDNLREFQHVSSNRA